MSGCNGCGGPQHAELVRLIERICLLTSEDLERIADNPRTVGAEMAEAWDAVRFAVAADDLDMTELLMLDVMATAAGALIYVVYVNEPNFAYSFVNVVTYSLVDVVLSAAVGLAARHLVGKYGFTYDHYRILTDAWVSVFGKLHSDDHD